MKLEYDTQGSTAKMVGLIDGILTHNGYTPTGAHHFAIHRRADGVIFVTINPANKPSE